MSWRARCGSIRPMIGRMSSRSRTCRTGVDRSADRFLLLADDALALLDEADGHGDRDAVGGGLVGVEDAVQQPHVAVVLGEQRPREHVAQQEHDAHDLVRLDAAGNDALGEVARIGLERLHRARLERLHVAVVDGRGLREDLLAAHRRQELGAGDAAHPLLAELGPVLPQVRDELSQQRGRGLGRGLRQGRPLITHSAALPCSMTTVVWTRRSPPRQRQLARDTMSRRMPRSRSSATGLATCRSKPASALRRRSAGVVRLVSATSQTP